MRTYQWIEEMLTDLETFSELNNLPLLQNSVSQAREVFRVESANMALRASVTRLNVVLSDSAASVHLQPRVSGQVIDLFSSVAAGQGRLG